MSDYILEMKNITKEFSKVKALDDVSFKVKRGQIHALVGENGAGKSTLMNVLSGVWPYGEYTGELYVNDTLCQFRNIDQSEKAGIVIIHQELALIPLLSIAENIFLGNETAKNGIINWDLAKQKSLELMKEVDLKENPDTLITNISVGKQQLVEIAKAISKKVSVLILDEPTASLNENDSQNLLELLRKLKRNGVTCIMISHKLNEITQIADSITILRDGKTVADMHREDGEFSEEEIIRHMVGRELTDRFPKRVPKIGDMLLEVKDWTVYHPQHTERKMIDNLSLNVRKGEVVGIAGLMGAGRTEFAMSLFGQSYGRNISGEVTVHGKKVNVNTVASAVENGIAYVSEDRKSLGLIAMQDVKKNLTITNLKRVSNRSIIDENKEINEAERLTKEFGVRCQSINQIVRTLSGGNQQKVVLAKWMFSEPELLILDEPTRGIDVGAKYEIYTIINELVAQGKGVLVISSELPELLGICDRIYIMNKGRINGEMSVKEAAQETIMKLLV
ncbi:MAG: multiple monosaccharide ABC transporter ATP-binding protein [Christensenellales bacterium]|jgi:putative multiple sugar transport system ATP-binding protein